MTTNDVVSEGTSTRAKSLALLQLHTTLPSPNVFELCIV